MSQYGGDVKTLSKWQKFIQQNYRNVANELQSKELRVVVKELSKRYRAEGNVPKVVYRSQCYKLPEDNCRDIGVCRYVTPKKLTKKGNVRKSYCTKSHFIEQANPMMAINGDIFRPSRPERPYRVGAPARTARPQHVSPKNVQCIEYKTQGKCVEQDDCDWNQHLKKCYKSF